MSAVRGYQGQTDRIARCLTAAGDVTPAAASPLDDVLAAAGRHPGDYSSKIDVKLTAEMPARSALEEVLLRLLDTLEANVPGTIRDTQPKNDTISGMLNNLYLMADSYLGELADRSGGQLYRADTVGSLPQAFAAIAAELRTQYLLGYYPTNKAHDDSYRKIQVKTSRKDIAVRARPGYRAKTVE